MEGIVARFDLEVCGLGDAPVCGRGAVPDVTDLGGPLPYCAGLRGEVGLVPVRRTREGNECVCGSGGSRKHHHNKPAPVDSGRALLR